MAPLTLPLVAQQSVDLSVIVCCHNSATRLPPTLDALQAQVAPGRRWEVLIVDNCSTDNTAAVAQQRWTRKDVELWMVRATPAGQSYAREAGIQASRGRYILFCDDDNWLTPSYVEKAVRILDSNTSTAGLGGRGIPECEVPPPAWLPSQERIYATGPQAASDHAIVELLYGAGLVVRRSALADIQRANLASILTGRVGQKLTSGDDTELCYLLRLLGHQLRYNSELVFRHHIPVRRLTLAYLENLYAGFGRGRPLLYLYRAALQVKRPQPSLIDFHLYIFACASRDVATGIWNALVLLFQRRSADRAFRYMLRSAMVAQLSLLWNTAERRRYLTLFKQLCRHCESRGSRLAVPTSSKARACVTR